MTTGLLAERNFSFGIEADDVEGLFADIDADRCEDLGCMGFRHIRLLLVQAGKPDSSYPAGGGSRTIPFPATRQAPKGVLSAPFGSGVGARSREQVAICRVKHAAGLHRLHSGDNSLPSYATLGKASQSQQQSQNIVFQGCRAWVRSGEALRDGQALFVVRMGASQVTLSDLHVGDLHDAQTYVPLRRESEEQ